MRKSFHVSAALLFAVLSFTHRALGQASPNAVAQANQEYKAGHFRKAIASYESAVKAGHLNAAIFYNLGNAWFRAGDFGRAILNYERALVLKPHHPEATANLRLTQDKARALELRPVWWNRWTGRVFPDRYAIVAAVSGWLAVFALALWLTHRRRGIMALLTWLLGFAICAAAAAGLYALETGRNGRALAIVTGKNIEARVATADNANTVLILPAGSEIDILSARGDWIYAALPNEQRGWIPAGSAERVRL